jgi:hypothetical protein
MADAPGAIDGVVGGPIYPECMDIRYCAECGEETVDAGLAFWPGIDEPVAIVVCGDPGCGWTGTEAEFWVFAVEADEVSAA